MERRDKIITMGIFMISISFLIYLSLPYAAVTESNTFQPVLGGENLTNYESTCVDFNSSQVSDNPSGLIGQKVKLEGQITKINQFQQFGKNRTYIELVPKYSADYYIIVSYSELTPFKAGDNITVYGKYEYPVKTTVTKELADKNLVRINSVKIERV